MSERLPMPDWSRPGETWRVEPERGWTVDSRADWLCEANRGHCHKLSRAYLTNGRRDTAYCDEHLAKSLMWIENERVISWRLSK